MEFIIILLLGALTLVSMSLQRTYNNVPKKELKKRARKGDKLADALYKAAAYGHSLRAVLWALVVVFSALFFMYVSKTTQTWFGFMAIAVLVWVGFLWLPAQDATKFGVWLAGKIAPVLAWFLQYLHPVIDAVSRRIRKHRPIKIHTGLYDKADLIDLFERQQVQADNRVDEGTLQIAAHVLKFADKHVEDVLTPRRVVRAISSGDVVGPVLMTELHKSGFSRFPVYEGKQDNIVGVLYLRDVVRAKAGGQISKIMQKQVCYVHEDQSLHEVLQAILKTHQHLFVVVNGFEEYVGIITIEDILEELLGQQIVDEFDQYEDMRAVAQIHARKEHKNNHHTTQVVDEGSTDKLE